MGGPSILKTPNSLHIFTMKPPSSSSSLICTMKLKSLLHTYIFYRIARAFDKAKSLLLELLGELQYVEFRILKKNKKQKKLFFGSFRLHYNWCTTTSSHVHPNSHVYYDASWNTTTSLHDDEQEMDGSDELSTYLEWLDEEKKKKKSVEECSGRCNEIDELADLFIANCHEKFRLEKQESYRRFQDMMARSTL